MLVASLAACTKSATGPTGTPRSALLALAHVDSFSPPSPVTATFKAGVLSHLTIQHTDSVGTAFATFTFVGHSVAFRHDSTLADTSTVSVTVTIIPGSYEFVIGPASLGFNPSNRPTVSLSYTSYANPAVFDSSSRYATAGAFEQALGLWFERGGDQWIKESGSPSGFTLTGPLDAPGHYLLAAPK